MTEPESQDDQNKTGQKSAESPLVQDVGEVATNKSTDATGGSREDQQSANKPIKFPVKIWGNVAWYWESLKGKGKSNRMIAVATFVIAIAAFATWREAYNAGAQTDRIIAADERIASGIENTVDQANKSLNASIDATRTDQRAWVGVENFEIVGTVSTNKPMLISINYINTGKTPGLDVTLTNCGTGDTEAAMIEWRCPVG
jgi:hypothetical protein